MAPQRFAPELVYDSRVFKLDLAVVTHPGPNGSLITTKISEAPMYAVLPDGSAFRAKDAVTLNDLGDSE